MKEVLFKKGPKALFEPRSRDEKPRTGEFLYVEVKNKDTHCSFNAMYRRGYFYDIHSEEKSSLKRL